MSSLEAIAGTLTLAESTSYQLIPIYRPYQAIASYVLNMPDLCYGVRGFRSFSESYIKNLINYNLKLTKLT